jgi:pimeloyl-ACP methyl ester carboxylesterase
MSTTVLPAVDAETAARAGLTVGLNGQSFKRIKVNGAELAYVDEGSGQPVVFVHGGFVDLTAWQQQVPAVAQRYRAIAYSRRYAWPNEGVPDDVADEVLAHAEDLAGLIRALELGPTHLVGHSYGAGVCMIAALKHPELARTLVLMEPGIVPSLGMPPRPQAILKLLLTQPRLGRALMAFGMKCIEPTSAALKRGETEQAIRVFVDWISAEPNFYDRLPADVKRHMLANSKILRSFFFGKGAPPFGEDNVRRIIQPTLLVVGERTPAYFLRTADGLANLLPNAQRTVVPNAAHPMQWQNSAGLNQAILSFLGRYDN